MFVSPPQHSIGGPRSWVTFAAAAVLVVAATLHVPRAMVDAAASQARHGVHSPQPFSVNAVTTAGVGDDEIAASAAADHAAANHHQSKTTTTTATSPPPSPLNDRPIVGVLAQEVGWHLEGKWPGVYHSYIAASYVKFVEGGGARVVPIWIGRPREYYENIMSKINGVLLPGGATWFNARGGYADAGRYILETAMRMNDAGQVMPLWGTCLGMELLAYLTSTKGDPRAECYSQRQALHLEFEPDFRDSKLFGRAPQDVVDILASEAVTANFHSFCLTRENISAFGMADIWRVLSVNKDLNGFEFVSAMEHYRYPFYGVIFHPEKPLYEWVRDRNIPHTATAIRANQYFAAVFVDECRRSRHEFAGGVDEENGVLIYNYATNFTGLVKSAYQECYMFEANADYVQRLGANDVDGVRIDEQLNENGTDFTSEL